MFSLCASEKAQVKERESFERFFGFSISLLTNQKGVLSQQKQTSLLVVSLATRLFAQAAHLTTSPLTKPPFLLLSLAKAATSTTTYC